MPRKAKATPPADLHITIENEDWIAIYGTPAELAKLGQAILDLANAKGPEEAFIGQDPITPPFRPGSLGYMVYRRNSGFKID